MNRILLASLALLSLGACTVTTPSVTLGNSPPPPAPAPAAPVIVQQPAQPAVIVH
jgi:hypothetical protein